MIELEEFNREQVSDKRWAEIKAGHGSYNVGFGTDAVVTVTLNVSRPGKEPLEVVARNGQIIRPEVTDEDTPIEE